MPSRSPASESRPSVVAVAWTKQTGRAVDLARIVGGIPLQTAYQGRSRMLDRAAPIRWLLSAAETARVLLRTRPSAVIVQNPPVFAPLFVALLARILGYVVVLDSHPASFGLKGKRLWRLFLPVHRAIARRSVATLVTSDDLANEVRAWGASPIVLHEPPPIETAHGEIPEAVRVAASAHRSWVLFACVFDADEPVDAVLDAARATPETAFVVTGDVTKAPATFAGRTPNVIPTGFVPRAVFDALVAEAGAVLSLTTEPDSVMRSAYEAVYARRPLIISDHPNLRDLFPLATFATNDGASLAAAVRAAAAQADAATRAEQAAAIQHERWAAQEEALRAAVSATRRS